MERLTEYAGVKHFVAFSRKRLAALGRLRSLARLLVEAQSFMDSARRKIDYALGANSKSPRLRLAKAQIEAARGNADAAEQNFRFVVAAQPGNSIARLGLANMLSARSQHAAALEELDRALAIDSANLQARLMRGQIQAAMQRYADAIETFRSVRVDEPSNDNAIDSLTQIYIHEDRMDDLIVLLRSVIEGGYGTEKRSRYLADAIVAAAPKSKAIALTPVAIDEIEQSPLTSASQSAAAIQRNTYVVARDLYDANAKAFFWELAQSHFVRSTQTQPVYVHALHRCRETGETSASRLFETDIALFRHILNARVVAIAEAYFRQFAYEPAFVMPYHAINCRYFQPTTKSVNPNSMLPFHQDGIGFPRTYRVLNFWTLLYPDECGVTSPGLDFVSAAPDVFIPVGKGDTAEQYAYLKTNSAFMDELIRQFPPITPSVKHGDAIIFNELALHRTSLANGLTQARASAEIRLIAATKGIMEELDNGGIPYAHVFRKDGVRHIRWASKFAQEKSSDLAWLVPGANRPVEFSEELL
jgi:tetratricopeptide (TPR) repeat protein